MSDAHGFPCSQAWPSAALATPLQPAADVLTSAPSVHRLKLRCRRCGKFRNPDEFILGNVIGYCCHCYEQHGQAMNVLQGGIPTGCAECGVSFTDLQALAAPHHARMFLHWIEGLYALLCPSCSDRYERKRSDLYGDTPYGAARNLKGTH